MLVTLAALAVAAPACALFPRAVARSTGPGRGDASQEVSLQEDTVMYIAALGDPRASSGNNAQSWGLWRRDPGPRGVRMSDFPELAAAGNVAPSKWRFDSNDWWVEEHGLIMEKPDFPLPPGQYFVTGGREVAAWLTVQPMDEDGAQKWMLAGTAKLGEVTHLPCRSARYTPQHFGTESCSPASMLPGAFPVAPGGAMPPISGCKQQDFAVLIVTKLG